MAKGERPRLDVTLVSDGQVIGGDRSDDEDNLMIVYVVNRGGASTTLENLFLFEFESGLSRWRRRPKRSLIVTNPQLNGDPPNLPFLLDPNRRWSGIVRKERIEFDLRTGDFYVGIGASHAKRANRRGHWAAAAAARSAGMEGRQLSALSLSDGRFLRLGD